MNKNRNFLKSLLVALIGMWTMVSVSYAVSLKIDYGQLGYGAGRMLSSGNVSLIHFADNGNSFWGFFYFNDVSVWSSESHEWDDETPPCSCAPYEDENGEEIQKEYCETDTNVVYSCGEDHEILDEPAQYHVSLENGDTYDCRWQVQWFYYNSQRWERLWPLDESTASNWTFAGTVTWGIYTRCSKAGYNFESILNDCGEDENCIKEKQAEFYDTYSYYGMIAHEYQNQEWQLIMWVNYEKKDPRFELASNLQLSSTFQRLGNKFPVWFIYDYNGWLGFVWCTVVTPSVLENLLNDIRDKWTIQDAVVFNEEAENRENMIQYTGLNCKDVGSAADSLIGLIVDWLVWMWNNTNSPGVAGNTTSDKMQFFWSVDVNNATLINFTKQKAESLCRWKWKNNSQCDNNSERVCCLSPNTRTTINADSSNNKNKTLIVKNWDVMVKPIESRSDTNYYDIFIDGGNLLIKEEESDSQFVIWRNGFVTDIAVGTFNDEVETHYSGHTSYYEGTWVAVASVIRGNFIVNGGVKNSNGGGLDNKYFIYWKFTTNKTYDELEKIFKRRCDAGVDGKNNRCPEYDVDWQGRDKSSYRNAFLVVIDQNYDSPLYW